MDTFSFTSRNGTEVACYRWRTTASRRVWCRSRTGWASMGDLLAAARRRLSSGLDQTRSVMRFRAADQDAV
jgi:hypothetical protein